MCHPWEPSRLLVLFHLELVLFRLELVLFRLELVLGTATWWLCFPGCGSGS